MKIKNSSKYDAFFPVHLSLEIPFGNNIPVTVTHVAEWFRSAGDEYEATMKAVIGATIRIPIADRFVKQELEALTAGIMQNLLDPSAVWSNQQINVWVGRCHVIKLSKNRQPAGIYKVSVAAR